MVPTAEPFAFATTPIRRPKSGGMARVLVLALLLLLGGGAAGVYFLMNNQPEERPQANNKGKVATSTNLDTALEGKGNGEKPGNNPESTELANKGGTDTGTNPNPGTEPKKTETPPLPEPMKTETPPMPEPMKTETLPTQPTLPEKKVPDPVLDPDLPTLPTTPKKPEVKPENPGLDPDLPTLPLTPKKPEPPKGDQYRTNLTKENQGKVNNAIERGVAYLKSCSAAGRQLGWGPGITSAMRHCPR